MTTFNFRAAKDDKDILDQAEGVVEAATGTRPNLGGSRITVVDEADGDARIAALDFAPENQAVRGGTVGVSRGAMRGMR